MEAKLALSNWKINPLKETSRDGGTWRSLQINDHLVKQGYTVHYLVDDYNDLPLPSRVSALFHLLRYLPVILRFGYPLRRVLFTMRMTLKYEKLFKKFSNQPTLVLEDTNMLFPVIAAVCNNIPIIAYPHNLESLVPDNRMFFLKKSVFKRFAFEIKHLALAKKIFCISFEESWLLSCLGLPASVLLSDSSIQRKAFFTEINEARQSSSILDGFLILGSVYNPPSRMGFTELINMLSREEFDKFHFRVAGNHTQILAGDYQKPNIEFLGEIDEDSLKSELSKTKAMIIHHVATSGVLTRIQDALHCGIPVIANPFAAKSYYFHPSIRIYQNSSELHKALKMT